MTALIMPAFPDWKTFFRKLEGVGLLRCNTDDWLSKNALVNRHVLE